MFRHLIPLVFAGTGLTFIGLSLIEREPRLLYNPSPSAPIGWYKITPSETYAVGDLVAAWLPEEAEILAAERGYLPERTPVIKTIVAGPEDRYCVENNTLIVGENVQFEIHHSDSQGRVMPVLSEGCRRLAGAKYMVVSERIIRSFDSRYFGEIDGSAIIGKAGLVGSVAEELQPGNSEKGGARGPGAQGKIKALCTRTRLTPCLHIDFHGTKLNSFAPSNPVFTNTYYSLGLHYRTIVHDSSPGSYR